jgi:hypothetical protein
VGNLEMGIWVKIRKLHASENIGDYVILKPNDSDDADFYMRIDRKNRKLCFYSSSDFTNAIMVVDSNDGDIPMGELPGVSMIQYSRALLRGIKALDGNTWPDSLDYMA